MKIFSYIRNILYKMGFNAKNVVVKGEQTSTAGVDLNKQEIEFLLLTIKNGMFKGENVELLYNLTLKLQKGFIALK